MTSLERRLHDALTGVAADVEPAPDLKLRVRRSLANDARLARTRRAHRVLALVSVPLGGAALLWGVTQSSSYRQKRGEAGMNWWVLELLTTAVLIALAIWLGPFIKRYGKAYAADVFHDNPLTGKSYIVLTDIVYYLIFSAYILITMRFEPAADWPPGISAPQLAESVKRVGGILLVIGILHGLNLLLMPVLGRIFSLNRRLDAPTTIAPSQREAIDRPD